jgi:hypothetical protein
MDAARTAAPSEATEPAEALTDGQLAGAAVLGGATLQRVATPFVTAVKVQCPRDIKRVTIEALHEAELMREDYYWEWEVREKNRRTGKYRRKLLRGISIDGALSLLRLWGNCACMPELSAETVDKWTFLVSFVDHESGTTVGRLYQKPKSAAPGGFDQERWDAMMFQDGQSKAERNAIEKSMPKWLVRRCIEAAKAAAVKALNDKETLARERKDIIARAKELGLTGNQLKAKAGKSVNSYGAEDIVTMKALLQAIEDGDATAEQMFGRTETERKPEQAPPKRKAEPPRQTKKQSIKPRDESKKDESKKATPPRETLFEQYARQLKDAKDEQELEFVGTDVEDKLGKGELTKAEGDELAEIAGRVSKKLRAAVKE